MPKEVDGKIQAGQDDNFWSFIPPWVLSNDELSPLEKMLFGRVLALSNRDGYCWASNEYLCKYICSVRSVQRTLTVLINKKLISIVYGKGNDGLTTRKIYTTHDNLSPHDKLSPNSISNTSNISNSNTVTGVTVDQSTNETVLLCKHKKLQQECSLCTFAPCTPLQIWNIANDLDIFYDEVKEKHDVIMEMVESGEMHRRYKTYKSTYYTLRSWLRLALDKGRIERMNEMERMTMKERHPDRISVVQDAIKYARERGMI